MNRKCKFHYYSNYWKERALELMIPFKVVINSNLYCRCKVDLNRTGDTHPLSQHVPVDDSKYQFLGCAK